MADILPYLFFLETDSRGIRGILTLTCYGPSLLTIGVQRVHVRQTAVLKALPGVCYPAPEPEEGVFQLQLPEASR